MKSKSKLAKRIANTVAEELNVDMGDVSVAIEEVPREEWGEKVCKVEIKDNPNIYHKPDYEYWKGISKMRDMHIHTEFSCDSEAKMESYILEAKKKGMKTICFTDHVDLNTNDYGYDYYAADGFWSKFNEIKSNVNSTIEMLAGIEFGEPHLYEKCLKELTKYPYDFVIGSIHWIGDMFPCQKVREQYSAKEFYTLYWQEVLKTVKTGGFDVLGHIDFPKRYYGEIYYEESVINEIFRNLLEKDLVIEINTSSLRKGHAQTMPGKELLEIYKANGGKYVSIGSDAHVVEDIGADYMIAKSLLEEVGLQEVIYRQRKRQII